jgi:hypothetical protein
VPLQLPLINASQVALSHLLVCRQCHVQQPPQLTLDSKVLKALVLDLLNLVVA